MPIFLIVAAIFGKVITGFSVFGQSPVNRLAIGYGIIPKSEVGLIFAGVAATSNLLSQPLGVVIIHHGYSHNLISHSPVKFVFSFKITQHAKRSRASHFKGVGKIFYQQVFTP